MARIASQGCAGCPPEVMGIGHPIGASGARIVVTRIDEMKRRNLHKGTATLCIGGGMGAALCVEM